MKLKSRTKRTQVFNLPHDVVCGDVCLCQTVQHKSVDHNPKTGEVGIRHSDRLVAASVHLAPGGESDDLPETVKNVPEIADALKIRRVEIC